MRTLGLLLPLAALAAGAPYAAGPAPHEVAVVAEHRLDDLPLRITHPSSAGKHPVIVFSHGLYGSKDGYEPLIRFLAAHGYVCIQPTHPDSARLGPKPRHEAVRAWDERPRQVTRVLDALERLEKELPALAGKLDRTRIGVGGHSFGAHTAQLLAGVTAYAGGPRRFHDERVKAALLISPQGRGRLFREDSWQTLAVPTLVITGSNDESPLTGEKPEWRLDAYRLAPEGDRYLVWIEGAHHGFGGISGVHWPGAGPRNEAHVDAVRQAALAFFDAFVAGDGKAEAWLRAGEMGEGVRCENKVPTGSGAPPDRPEPSR